MEFEKAMRSAEQYLTFEPRFIDPTAPQGLWICANLTEVSAIRINAVCLGMTCQWDDVVRCRPFFDAFPYLVIATPNAIAREQLVKELRPRLPACCIYTVSDAGWRNCKTAADYVQLYGLAHLPDILAGAKELPAYGLLNLAEVPPRDMSKIPRTLSHFEILDQSIGGFYAGELSVWTGKRGIGKSTLLSQLLLEAINQGHCVCAYSGELPKEQFREWTYLQAAGPEHISYVEDPATGKRLATANPMADKRISEWLNERFWLFDLEHNTRHDPETILKQFEYAKMRYNCDVFLVDNIMSVDFDGYSDRDFNRIQSKFTSMLVTFSKRRGVHTHLVVHPRKSTSDNNAKITSDDVSGSGDITNRADNVFFLTTHETDGENKPLLQVLKNRDFGSHRHQWLDFDKKSRRFFQDKTGDPKRPYNWEERGVQLELTEEHADVDAVFPPSQGAQKSEKEINK